MRASSPFDSQGTVIAVHQGDCIVSGDARAALSTVLGSCISACVRDKVAGVGGMNHFLLAAQSDSARDRYGASARYGAFAMEQLINRVLGQGTGNKANLEFKVFGGGNIHPGMMDIGSANIAFLRTFLKDEGYQAVGEDLGGTFARRVMYQPTTGRALVKRLDSSESVKLVRDEIALVTRLPRPETGADVELF